MFPERRRYMKKTLVKAISSITFLAMMGPGLLSAAECVPGAPNGWMAPFSMVTLKNYATNQYASYATGVLYSSSTSALFSQSETYSGSGNQQLFSDRGAEVNCPPAGQFGFCSYQPFDINKADKLGVSVTKSSSFLIVPGGSGTSYSGTVTLESWGNGKITFPLTCDANTGILYGAIGNDSHVAITIGLPFSPPK
jgi:hypothetical protein